MKNIKKIKYLGKKNKGINSPESFKLDALDNPHPDSNYSIRFSSPELTSICPITSQPDFGNIVIDYVPNKFIVESKSFKLYLLGYRNHGAVHEDCTISLAQDIIDLLSQKWLRIAGYWYPRGGIPIDIFWQTGEKPENLFLPDHDVPIYRGRG